jgi:hypothetical protein
MPGEGVGYFTATTLGSLAVLAGSWWLGRRRERSAPWVMAAILLLLVAKAVLHRRPDWEAALFPWPGYAYFQGYWLYPIGIAVLGIGGGRLPVRWNRAVVGGTAVALLLAGVWGARWMVVPIDDSSTRTADARHHCAQSEGYTCAPASCVMLLSLYGIEATEGEMARKCLTGSWGTSTFDIYRGLLVKLEDAGLAPEVVSADVEELRTLRRPAIVGQGRAHAVVVEFRESAVLVRDPLDTAPSWLDVDRFRERYDGIAVVLDRPPGPR